jgi:hypothetical protein
MRRLNNRKKRKQQWAPTSNVRACCENRVHVFFPNLKINMFFPPIFFHLLMERPPHNKLPTGKYRITD